jgi:ankyrin repeat protein
VRLSVSKMYYYDRSVQGYTALMSAAGFGNVSVVDGILKAGADVNTVDNWVCTTRFSES